MEVPITIRFSERQVAVAANAGSGSVSSALKALGLRSAPTLVVIGGASKLTNRDAAKLKPLERELWRMVHDLEVTVVDGGTDVGLMRLNGQARLNTQSQGPLVGVAIGGLVTWPGGPASTGRFSLEPNHSHFVLVPGSAWGDEGPWLADVASNLADGFKSLTVLINGGDLSWQDVTYSVDAGRPVLAISGTGRTADDLAGSSLVHSKDARLKARLGSGLIESIELAKGPQAVVSAIRDRLMEGSNGLRG
jgi:hypothetical protein